MIEELKRLWTELVYEFSQFFRPFPEPGSMAYNIHTRQYDKTHGGPVVDDINIDPLKEVDNGNDDRGENSDIRDLDSGDHPDAPKHSDPVDYGSDGDLFI